MKKLKIRQLSKNEKALLTILGAVILFWISYKFIYIPQNEKLEALKLKRAEYELAIEDINTTLRKENAIKTEWHDLNIEKERVVSNYFPTLDQPQIIYLLNELIAHENVNIEDISFTRPEITEFEGFQVNSMDIAIPYSGNYLGIMDVLESINGSSRKIMVDNLSMDANAENTLSGNMSLRVYSLDGIVDSDPNVIYVDTSLNQKKENPFKVYADNNEDLATEDGSGEGALSEEEKSQSEIQSEYFKQNGESSAGASSEELSESDSSFGPSSGTSGSSGPLGFSGYVGSASGVEDLNPNIEEVLLDFESKNNFFIPSQELVKGDVSLSTNAKSKKHSLKLEYNIVGNAKENRAFIDVTRNNIKIKYPPTSIGMWIYSYDYSPVTVGIRFKGQMGEEILVPLSEGIGWTGWKYVEAPSPSELGLYPMRLENLYLEVPDGRDGYGILLIDKLQAIYPRNIDTDGKDGSIGNFIFYLVDKGDTVEKISESYYGNKKYVNEISKLNEIRPGEVLKAGKVLVLKKR